MKSGVKLRSGITLLEVILALMMLSLTVVGAMRAASQCLAVSDRVRHFDHAKRTLDAGNLAYPISVTNEIDELGVEPVELGLEGYTYSRTLVADEADEHSFLITTRVSWRAEGREQSFDVHGFLYSTNHP